MSKYPASHPEDPSGLKDAQPVDLEFPTDPEFLSLPPRLAPDVMFQRIAETMPWRSTRPGESERRLAMVVDVEFVL